jgi:hypothetical protein
MNFHSDSQQPFALVEIFIAILSSLSRLFRLAVYTTISIKVVHEQSGKVEYEREGC